MHTGEPSWSQRKKQKVCAFCHPSHIVHFGPLACRGVEELRQAVEQAVDAPATKW